MGWTLALDGVVIVLLGVGIFYAWRLERMLRGLDRNRAEMEKFVGVFSSAVARAERGIRELQDTAQDVGVDVDRHIAKAAGLRDELNYLIDAADKMATRLTDTSSAALARKPAAPAPVAVEELAPIKVTVAPPKLVEPLVEKPKADLASALPPWAKPARQDHIIVNRPEKTFTRQTEKTPLSKTAEALPVMPMERSGLRSEAERELQQALEKMR
ncbi:MAG: hypothetical protein HY053_00830 [Proteobacteria bacterium]|nr:hypothetical protein [Pseudomonadota bacterium]